MHTKHPFLALAITVAIAPLPCSLAQWTPVPTNGPTPPALVFGGLVYDSARHVLVHFGGTNGQSSFNDTWELDLATMTWSQITTANRPSGRHAFGMAYDANRQVVVLWGGATGSPPSFQGDTWEYDGQDWTQRSPSNSPTERCGCRMVWDAATGRILMTYGEGTQVYQDSWTYDGTTWAQVATGAGGTPPGRTFHTLTTDGADFYMHGGRLGSAVFGDFWRYDGTGWNSIVTPTAPPPRFNAATATLANGAILLHGGSAAPNNCQGCIFDDAWLFDGTDWQLVNIGGTLARHRHHIVRTPAGVFAFGGQTASNVLKADLHEFVLSSASTVTATAEPPSNPPTKIRDHALAARPGGGAVLFGGRSAAGPFALTYEFDGATWNKQFPTFNPMPRTGHTFVLDAARQQNVLFGGANFAGVALAETWTYRDGQWTFRTPANSPPARSGHAAAYDPTTDRTFVFGGLGASGAALGDTWAWDGNNWTLRNSASQPPARSGHGLAWDDRRGRLVMFGGHDGSGLLDDVWEWDGAGWTQVVPTQPNGTPFGPSARAGFVMAYDRLAERVVLVGGEDVGGCNHDVWSWDGSSWTIHLATGSSLPSARSHAAGFVDRHRDQLLLFGGGCGSTLHDDLWSFVFPVFSRHESFGTGCPGTNGIPSLSLDASTPPIVGTTMTLVYSDMASPLLPAFGAYGSSRTSWSGVPLPLDLGPAGLPGCPLLQSSEVVETIGLATQTQPLSVEWNVAIPNLAPLIGQHFFLQGLHLELVTHPTFAAVSNGIAIRIGVQ